MTRLSFFITGIAMSYGSLAQNLTLSPTIGFASLKNKVPPLTSTQAVQRQIQYANVFSLEAGKRFSSRLNAGVSATYTYAALNRIISTGVNQGAIGVVRFPSVGAYGKYFLCTSCKYRLYVYGGSSYAFDYPSKMNDSEMETAAKVLSGVSIGLESLAFGAVSYLLELGYWNSGVIARGGIVYAFKK